MSENDDRTEERPRAVEKLEDGVEVFGGGEGVDEGALDTAAAVENNERLTRSGPRGGLRPRALSVWHVST